MLKANLDNQLQRLLLQLQVPQMKMLSMCQLASFVSGFSLSLNYPWSFLLISSLYHFSFPSAFEYISQIDPRIYSKFSATSTLGKTSSQMAKSFFSAVKDERNCTPCQFLLLVLKKIQLWLCERRFVLPFLLTILTILIYKHRDSYSQREKENKDFGPCVQSRIEHLQVAAKQYIVRSHNTQLLTGCVQASPTSSQFFFLFNLVFFIHV